MERERGKKGGVENKEKRPIRLRIRTVFDYKNGRCPWILGNGRPLIPVGSTLPA